MSVTIRAIFVTKTKTKTRTIALRSVSTKTRTITNEKTKTKNLGQTIQRYCANQPWHSNANITWLLVIGLKNSGIIWWLSSWISTSLMKSSTRLLIWLRQMPPHSGNRSRLFTAGWLLLGRILYAHQHHRLTWSVFFFCVLHSVYSGRRSSMQQSLEMCTCLRKFVCASWFALWELSSVFVSDSSIRTALHCLKTMVDSYFLANVVIWCYCQEKFVFLNK